MVVEEIIEELNIIYDLIKEEKYEKAMEYIQGKKIEYSLKKDPVNKYLDELVSELK